MAKDEDLLKHFMTNTWLALKHVMNKELNESVCVARDVLH